MSTQAKLLSADAEKHLRQFRRAVEEALPGQITDMRLFGSRARGDAEADSDYDVAVFVNDLDTRTQTDSVLSDLAYPHVLEGYYIRAIGLPADYLNRPLGIRTELAEEIARDGIPLP